LLMDIKPGYMLGAKPRQQAVGHIIGIISGAIAGTILFFPLFTTGVDRADIKGTIDNIQSEKFGMPAVTVWVGVAKALTEGLFQLPNSAVIAIVVAAVAGIGLELGRIFTKNKLPISPVALGLAFVLDFKSSVCMFAGAVFFWAMGVGRHTKEKAEGNFWVQNHEAICAGIIAGAGLMGIADIAVEVFLVKD
jgi:uncharacterized oligopeptide transporter (OPT) family protein